MSTTIDAPGTRSHEASAPAVTSSVQTLVDQGPHIDWQIVESVQNMVWVGRVRGAFVGMIEARWGQGFAVTTRLGRGLGMFDTLEQAQEAFIKH